MKPLRHTWQVTLRYLRALFRQPAWIGITLVQPMIWLLLFGGLFKSIARIPGFHGGSYIEFLTPGLIVMLAISSAGWSGMAYIEDMNLGVMDRFLVSPIWRGALNAGSVAQQVIIIALQSVIVAAISLAIGGHFPNGIGGVAVLIGVSALLGASFASLSNALALVVRQRESLIGAVTSVTLPLTFLSAAFMQETLAPHWIRVVARYNPVNWAVEAGRSAATQHTDWGLVASRTGFLVALLLISAWLATRSFRAYQRSI
jgi:ABC-2 type transport system permease protein